MISWKPGGDIRAQNLQTDFGHAKDYDAVVTVQGPNGEPRFALEYERTPNREPQYFEIQRKLGAETRVNCVLYLAPTHYALSQVQKWLRHAKAIVVFGVAPEFRKELLETRVTGPEPSLPLAFSKVLSR